MPLGKGSTLDAPNALLDSRTISLVGVIETEGARGLSVAMAVIAEPAEGEQDYDEITWMSG